MLRASLFESSHNFTFFSSLLTFLVSNAKSSDSQQILVSSAKRKKEKNFDEFGKSLMQIRNKSGPKTDPWGTPQDMSHREEEWPFTETNCFRLLRYELNLS